MIYYLKLYNLFIIIYKHCDEPLLHYTKRNIIKIKFYSNNKPK